LTVGYMDVKLVLFNAHGIWVPKWMLAPPQVQEQQSSSEQSEHQHHRREHFKFETREDFDRFHHRVGKKLAANMAQTIYRKRDFDLATRASAFDYDFRRTPKKLELEPIEEGKAKIRLAVSPSNMHSRL